MSNSLKSPTRRSVIAPRPVFSRSLARTHDAGSSREKPALHCSVLSTRGEDAPAGVRSCVAVTSAEASRGSTVAAAAVSATKNPLLCSCCPRSFSTFPLLALLILSSFDKQKAFPGLEGNLLARVQQTDLWRHRAEASWRPPTPVR